MLYYSARYNISINNLSEHAISPYFCSLLSMFHVKGNNNNIM